MNMNLDLLKQVRETADWFMELPQKLVAAAMGTKEDYFRRRERILKYKELAEIREVGKSIQNLYMAKGSIIGLAKMIREDQDIQYVEDVRELFGEVAARLEEISEIISETRISGLALGTEASMQLAKAKVTYEALRDLPNQALLDDERLVDILVSMEAMMKVGSILMAQVDDHRRTIDHSYG